MRGERITAGPQFPAPFLGPFAPVVIRAQTVGQVRVGVLQAHISNGRCFKHRAEKRKPFFNGHTGSLTELRTMYGIVPIC